MRLGPGEAHDTHANEVIACCVLKRCQVAPCVVYGHRHGNYSGLSRFKRVIRERTEHCNFVYFCVVCVYWYAWVLPFFYTERTHTRVSLVGPLHNLFVFFFLLLVITIVFVGSNRWRSFRPTVVDSLLEHLTIKRRMTIIETVGCSLCETAD